MACTHKSLWQDYLCWVSTIVTTTAEALSLGSAWKRNRPSGIIPPNGSTLFHRPKGDKCREWEKTPVRNGMRIKPGRRRMVFLLLSWWVRTIPRVLNLVDSGTCPLTLPDNAKSAKRKLLAPNSEKVQITPLMVIREPHKRFYAQDIVYNPSKNTDKSNDNSIAKICRIGLTLLRKALTSTHLK